MMCVGDDPADVNGVDSIDDTLTEYGGVSVIGLHCISFRQ